MACPLYQQIQLTQCTYILYSLFLFYQQAPHHQPSERRHENIMPAHQPRLYTGHQSHPYAHHHHHASSRVPTTSDSPGASAQRIHDMRCPAAFIGRPTTAASLLVPDLSTSQQPTSSATQMVSILLTAKPLCTRCPHWDVRFYWTSL